MSNLPEPIRKFEDKNKIYSRYTATSCQIVKSKPVLTSKIVFYKNTKKKLSVALDKERLFELCKNNDFPFTAETTIDFTSSFECKIGVANNKVSVNDCIIGLNDFNTKVLIEVLNSVDEKDDLLKLLTNEGELREGVFKEFKLKLFKSFDTPHKVKPLKDVNKKIYPRNKEYAEIALKQANYECEIDSSHKSFLNASTNNQYVEAHHLIPLKYHSVFKSCLDVPANIISLCPNCHRQLHHASVETIKTLIEMLLNNRLNRLQKCELGISPDHLTRLYEGINR